MSGLSINVDISQLRDFRGRFARMDDPAALLRASGIMLEAANEALVIAQTYAPKDSGDFAAGLHIEGFGEVGFAIATRPEDANVLLFLRDGTASNGTGRIYPVNARALVFGAERWRKGPGPNAPGGRYVFTSVRGQQANPWESEALNEILAQLTPLMNRAGLGITAQVGIEGT
jgi:hypothetical protein